MIRATRLTGQNMRISQDYELFSVTGNTKWSVKEQVTIADQIKVLVFGLRKFNIILK